MILNYNKKVLLLILDGVGVAPKSQGNAITLAQPQNLIKLWETYPSTYLEASGEAVGLVENTNGNSEVGHLTIGSGKIHYQNLLKINKAIKKGTFFSNNTFEKLLNHSLEKNSNIHLLGCLSDGSIHSHINHFFSVLEYLKEKDFQNKVFIHVFTDGRDTPQKSAKIYLELLEKKIAELGIGEIASICGRAYAMDRNNNLERTKKAFDLIVNGIGKKFDDWDKAIEHSYENGEIDEYIEPILISSEAKIKDNDSLLFMNFRPDRAVQLSKMIANSKIQDLFFASMVEYKSGFPKDVIFPKEYLSLPIGRIISEAGIKQIRIAESEKYPHVTYFFNGGQPIQFHGEERIKIPSANVATYDLQPEMSAYNIANSVKQVLADKKKNFRFAVVNIANGDMVGHTGDLNASIKAIKVIDDVSGKIVSLAKTHDWTTIITADHGNIERMIDEKTGLANPEHTLNPVPFLIVDEEIRRKNNKRLRLGSLSDVAPTILKIMGLKKASTMTGKSLI